MDFLGIAQARALGALDDQSVDAGVHSLERAAQRRRRVIDDDAGVFQQARVARRVAGRGGDEMHALAQQPVDDGALFRRIHLQVTNRQVDAEGLVGRGANGGELAGRDRKIAHGVFQQAHAARRRYR